MAAAINTTGAYSIVRHPLYLGNLLIWLGFVLYLEHWWFVLAFVLAYWIYYERIMLAEEAFLRRTFGAAFEAWAARTPAFLPNPRRWQRSAMPFCWRTVLRREYTALGGIALGFPLLETAADGIATGRLHIAQAGSLWQLPGRSCIWCCWPRVRGRVC